MQSALAAALDSAQQAGARRVLVIRLRIGALSGVVPEALEFAFQALAPGTPADGARLAVEHVPARFWCAPCSTEFTGEELFAECPACHTLSTQLRAGRELQLDSLEI